MSKSVIKVKILSNVKGHQWHHLKSIIIDSLANNVGINEYEFYTYGDALNFQHTCDDFGVKYLATDTSS